MHAAATIRMADLPAPSACATPSATLDASSDGLLIDSQGRTVMANARMEDFGFCTGRAAETTGEGSPGQLRELSEGWAMPRTS